MSWAWSPENEYPLHRSPCACAARRPRPRRTRCPQPPCAAPRAPCRTASRCCVKPHGSNIEGTRACPPRRTRGAQRLVVREHEPGLAREPLADVRRHVVEVFCTFVCSSGRTNIASRNVRVTRVLDEVMPFCCVSLATTPTSGMGSFPCSPPPPCGSTCVMPRRSASCAAALFPRSKSPRCSFGSGAHP